MARILFVTADTIDAGTLVLAAELRRRGHDVRVLGHVTQYPRVAAAGVGFAALAVAPAGTARDPRALDPRFGVDVRLELTRRSPDLVVVDPTLPTALKEAEASGVTTAVLVPGFFADVEAWARGPIRLAARLRRLRPGPLWAAAACVLVASDGGLDPATDLPSNARRTGPLLGPLRARVREFEPLVVVDLADASTVEQVVDALADEATVVLTREVPGLRLPDGPQDPVARDLPDALSRAWLSVGDGSHATAMAALANDLPVLAPASPVTDAVVAAGAGRVLDADPAAAARELLAEGPHHAAAAAIGERLRGQAGVTTAADALESLLRDAPTPG